MFVLAIVCLGIVFNIGKYVLESSRWINFFVMSFAVLTIVYHNVKMFQVQSFLKGNIEFRKYLMDINKSMMDLGDMDELEKYQNEQIELGVNLQQDEKYQLGVLAGINTARHVYEEKVMKTPYFKGQLEKNEHA